MVNNKQSWIWLKLKMECIWMECWLDSEVLKKSVTKVAGYVYCWWGWYRWHFWLLLVWVSIFRYLPSGTLYPIWKGEVRLWIVCRCLGKGYNSYYINLFGIQKWWGMQKTDWLQIGVGCFSVPWILNKYLVSGLEIRCGVRTKGAAWIIGCWCSVSVLNEISSFSYRLFSFWFYHWYV